MRFLIWIFFRRCRRPRPCLRPLTFKIMISAHVSQTATISLGPIPFTDGSNHEATEFPGVFTWSLLDFSDPTSPVPAGTLTPSADGASAVWTGAQDGTKAKVHVEGTVDGVVLKGDSDEVDWSAVAVPKGDALVVNVNLS